MIPVIKMQLSLEAGNCFKASFCLFHVPVLCGLHGGPTIAMWIYLRLPLFLLWFWELNTAFYARQTPTNNLCLCSSFNFNF